MTILSIVLLVIGVIGYGLDSNAKAHGVRLTLKDRLPVLAILVAADACIFMAYR
jgi:hypothetical protein